MAKRRVPIWLAAIVLAPLLLVTFIAGLWLYSSVTAEILHPNPRVVPTVTGQAPAPELSDSVERARQVVRAELSGQNLPGMSVAVGVGGSLVWAEGFGFANVQERTLVTPNMRFRLGTASIALTSIAAGLLLEKGSLKLDDEIQTYVPEYPKKQWPVTLRQLMAHTAGIRTDAGDEGPFGERCERPVEGLNLFKEKPLLFQPGTQYRFSSFGWILVSAAVEAAAREPIYAFMRNQIFEPLGMSDTRPDSATDPIPNRVTFYFPRFAADNRYGLQDAPPVDYSCYAGAYAFLSTPSDLVRFGLAVGGGRLLQPATVQLLQTSQRLPSGEETGYGLGWDLEAGEFSGAQRRIVGHDGDSVGGMVASLMSLPERGIVVAVMTNTSWVDTFEVAKKIAQAFEGTKTRPAGK
jgi:serine beta-lactamase-like protein LACTB, mitochondrial